MSKGVPLEKLTDLEVGLLGDPDSAPPERPEPSAVLIPVYVALPGTDDGQGKPRFGQGLVRLDDLLRFAASPKEA